MQHVSPISGIASYKDNYIATAGYDNQVILWEAKERKALNRVFHDHLANQCAFSPDGTLLVSSSSDYSARVWTVPDLQLKAALLGHTDDVEMAIFSPDSQRIATCSRDHSIRIFNLSGQCLHVMCGHLSDVISLCWSADGTRLISSSDDGTIRRWNTIEGKEIELIDMGGIETDSITLTKQGVIFAGNDEGELVVIPSDAEMPHRVFKAHDAGIKRVVWDEESQQLISLSYDRTVILWSYKDNTLTSLATSTLPSIIWPRSCTFVGATTVAFVTFGSTYALWDSMTNIWQLAGIESSISLNAVIYHQGNILSIGDAGILMKDGIPQSKMGSLCNFLLLIGERLLTGGQMGVLFDAITGERLYQHRSPLNCGTTFTKEGETYAAIGTYTGEALIFLLQHDNSLKFITSVLLHNNAIKDIAANDNDVFSVCATAAAAFHKIEDFSLITRIDHAHQRISNGCASAGDYFVSVGRDLKLRLWAGGESIAVYDTPHQHSIKCVAVSQQHSRILTGGYDGFLALFDAEKKEWITTNKATASGISSVTYSTDIGVFLASSYDGCIYHIDPINGKTLIEYASEI